MQQSAQDILQRQRNEKSNRNNDQHHHQARQKLGEHVNQILVSLLDSLDNHVLHGFTSTFSPSTFRSSTVFGAQTPGKGVQSPPPFLPPTNGHAAEDTNRDGRGTAAPRLARHDPG